MIELSEKLRQAREKQKLSIEEASEKIKIRPHILKALEKGDFSILPDIYARSSIINYANFLKINRQDIEEDLKTIFKPVSPKQYTNIIKEVPQYKGLKSLYDIKEIKKFLDKNHKKVVNYLVYIAIAISMLTLLYIAFFTGNSSSSELADEKLDDSADTTVIEYENKGLLSLFESKNDSLVFEATGIDSAWIEVNLDGKYKEQSLITPNDYRRWSAKDFIILTTGNVGAIEFKRNGEILPPLGRAGSVIRNIKITQDQVINLAISDSLRRSREAQKETPAPPLLEPSKIETRSFKPSFNEEDKKK